MTVHQKFPDFENLTIKSIQRIRNANGKGKPSLFMLSAIPLAACGGTGYEPEGKTNNGWSINGVTYTSVSTASETLNKSSATEDLIVRSGTGNDNITTGSGDDKIEGNGGSDIINSGAGDDYIYDIEGLNTVNAGAGNDYIAASGTLNGEDGNDYIEGYGSGKYTLNGGNGHDVLRGGIGADVINGGAGDDIIILVGTTGSNEYTSDQQIALPNPVADMTTILSLGGLDSRGNNEVVLGEVIDGGTGNDTIHIYGTVDLTKATVTNIETIILHSDLTIGLDQIGAGKISTITGSGTSTLRLESSDGTAQALDLSTINITTIKFIHVGENVTLTADSVASLLATGVKLLSGPGTINISGDTATIDLAGVSISDDTALTDSTGTTLDHATTNADVLYGFHIAGLEGISEIYFQPSTSPQGIVPNTIPPRSTRLDGPQISSAGDVNGDGLNDMLFQIGSNTYLVYGKASAQSDIDFATLVAGESVYLGPTTSFANVGDVNGDGYDDILMGNISSDTGQAHLIFGNANGFETIDFAALDGTTGVTFSGTHSLNYVGISVGRAGDINGDGLADIIIGGRDDSFAGGQDDRDNFKYKGEVYVVFGQTDGWQNIDVTALDGSNGFTLIGAEDELISNYVITTAGDINGDGYDDLLISASGLNEHNDGAYVIFGKASGWQAEYDLANLAPEMGFKIKGLNIDEFTARDLTSAGDINGDGYDDFMFSRLWGTNNNHENAEVHVIFGKATGWENGVDLATLANPDGFKITGLKSGPNTTSNNYPSAFSLSNAGDINGDGFDDIIIGAAWTTVDGATVGQSYVVFGKASGWADAIDISSLDGSNGFTINGADQGDYIGYSVAGIGDINGDGFDDFSIGGVGDTVVLYGKADGWGERVDLISLTTDTNTPTAQTLTGTVNADNLIGSALADTLDGDAGNDVLKAGVGADTLNGGTGDDRLWGGAGDDVFVFDLASGNDTIEDFEDGSDMIDLSSTGLSFADLTINTTGGDTLITAPDGSTITINGGGSDITVDDFIF